jgi:ABC-type phosphate transport system substrate-binding protein
VIPVDQLPESKVRAAFSKEVHGTSATAIAELWQQRGAGGTTPPAMLASDQEVLDFVRANPGAVGYVSATTELGPGLKELTLTED